MISESEGVMQVSVITDHCPKASLARAWNSAQRGSALIELFSNDNVFATKDSLGPAF